MIPKVFRNRSINTHSSSTMLLEEAKRKARVKLGLSPSGPMGKKKKAVAKEIARLIVGGK